MLPALIETVLIVQDQRIGSGFGNAHPVILPGHGSEVDDEQEVLFPCFIPADEAEDAPVAVVGVDPLEAVPVAVQPVKGRIFLVDMEQVAVIF